MTSDGGLTPDGTGMACQPACGDMICLSPPEACPSGWQRYCEIVDGGGLLIGCYKNRYGP